MPLGYADVAGVAFVVGGGAGVGAGAYIDGHDHIVENIVITLTVMTQLHGD